MAACTSSSSLACSNICARISCMDLSARSWCVDLSAIPGERKNPAPLGRTKIRNSSGPPGGGDGGAFVPGPTCRSDCFALFTELAGSFTGKRCFTHASDAFRSVLLRSSMFSAEPMAGREDEILGREGIPARSSHAFLGEPAGLWMHLVVLCSRASAFLLSSLIALKGIAGAGAADGEARTEGIFEVEAIVDCSGKKCTTFVTPKEIGPQKNPMTSNDLSLWQN